MKITTKLVFAVLSILMLSPVMILAAELIVKVTDEGNSVPMAEIILFDSKTRVMLNNNFTNKSGIYQYTVKPGLYEIKVIKDSFSTVTIKDIEVKNSNVKKVVALVPQAFSTEEKPEKPEDECD